MAGYTKQFNSAPGDTIGANLFNSEYQLLENAFNKTLGHTHNGLTVDDGALVPLISDVANLNSVEVSGDFNEITFNIDVANVKTLQLKMTDGLLVPMIDDQMDLGTPLKQFKDVYVAGDVNIGALEFSTGNRMIDILDDETMVADSDVAGVTQRSIKSYIDTTVSNAPGIFTQAIFQSRTTDFALSGGMAGYLSVTITVEEGSSCHVHSFMAAKGEQYAGGILASIWRDTDLVSTEDFYVTHNDQDTDFTGTEINFEGSTGRVDVDGPLTAGTYIYTIKMREQITNGIATQATLLVMEETA